MPPKMRVEEVQKRKLWKQLKEAFLKSDGRQWADGSACLRAHAEMHLKVSNAIRISTTMV